MESTGERDLPVDKVENDARLGNPVNPAVGIHMPPAAVFLRGAIIVYLDEAVVLHAAGVLGIDDGRALDLAEPMCGAETSWLVLQQIAGMRGTHPGPEDGRNGERRVDAVKVPVKTANAARDDGAVAARGGLAVVAEDCPVLRIANREEIRTIVDDASPPKDGVSRAQDVETHNRWALTWASEAQGVRWGRTTRNHPRGRL